jgi:endonuclease I
MVRVLSVWLFLLVALVAELPASSPQEPQVQMNFTKSHLVEVLHIYQRLVKRRVLVSEELRERLVSINTKEPIPRSEAAKLVESRLANYDIRIVEREGALVAVGPDDGEKTVYDPVMRSTECNAHLFKKEETDGLSGEPLKAKLQDITSERHASIGYALTKDVLMAIDEDPANTNNVITLYERKSVPKSSYFKGGPDTAWDREHVLPQSYGAKDGQFAKSDLHNLFPSLREINSLRGSLYFDESDDSEERPAKAPLASYDADSWEPPNEIKGDIARVVFYMDTRYDGSDSAQDIKIAEVPNRKEGVFGNLRTLLEWHKADPVSAKEKKRNNEIYGVQSNRNPFVDKPELVEKVYGNPDDGAANTSTKSFRATVRGNRYVFTFKGNGLLDSASVSGTNAFNFNVIGLKRNLIDTPSRPNDWLYKLWPNP